MASVDLTRVRLGMSRDEVVSVFGEPDLNGYPSRKYRTPAVFRYGTVEFLFEPWRSGGLVLVQVVDEFGSRVKSLIPTSESD